MYKKGAGIIIFILCLSLSAWGVLNPFGDLEGPSSLDSEEPPSLDLGSDGDGGDGLNLPPLNPDGTPQDTGDSSGTRGLTGGPASQGIPDATSGDLTDFEANLPDLDWTQIGDNTYLDPNNNIHQLTFQNNFVVDTVYSPTTPDTDLTTLTGTQQVNVTQRVYAYDSQDQFPGIDPSNPLNRIGDWALVGERQLNECEVDFSDEDGDGKSIPDPDTLLDLDTGDNNDDAIDLDGDGEKNFEILNNLPEVQTQESPEGTSGEISIEQILQDRGIDVENEVIRHGDYYYYMEGDTIHELSMMENGKIRERIYSNFYTPDGNNTLTVKQIISQIGAGAAHFNADVSEYIYEYDPDVNYTLGPGGIVKSNGLKTVEYGSVSYKRDLRINNSGTEDYSLSHQEVEYRDNGGEVEVKDLDGNWFSTATGLIVEDSDGNTYEWVTDGSAIVGLVKTTTDGKKELYNVRNVNSLRGKSDLGGIEHLLTLKADSFDRLKSLAGGEANLFGGKLVKSQDQDGRWFLGDTNNPTAILEIDADGNLTKYIKKEGNNLKVGIFQDPTNPSSWSEVTLNDPLPTIQAIYTNLEEQTPAELNLKNLDLDVVKVGDSFRLLIGNKGFVDFNSQGTAVLAGNIKEGSFQLFHVTNGTFDSERDRIGYRGWNYLASETEYNDIKEFFKHVSWNESEAKLEVENGTKKVTYTVDGDGRFVLSQSEEGSTSEEQKVLNAVAAQLGIPTGVTWKKLDDNSFYGQDANGNWYRIELPAPITDSPQQGTVYQFINGQIQKAEFTIQRTDDPDNPYGVTKESDFTQIATISSNLPISGITAESLAKASAISEQDGWLTFEFADGLQGVDLSGYGINGINSLSLKDQQIILHGQDASIKFYEEGSSWKAMAAYVDGQNNKLRFWEDASNPNSYREVVGQAASDIFGSDNVKSVLQKIDYNADTNVVIKKAGEKKYEVYRLKQGQSGGWGGSGGSENVFNAADKITVDGTNGTIQIGNRVINVSNEEFNSLLDILGITVNGEVDDEEIKAFASEIAGIKEAVSKFGASAPLQLIFQGNAAGKYVVVNLEENDNQGTEYALAKDDQGNIKSMVVDWESVRTTLGGDYSDKDILDSSVVENLIFDVDNNKVLLPDPDEAGSNEEGRHFRALGLNENGEVTSDDKELTPLGQGYEDFLTLCDLLQINPVEWKDYKTGFESQNRQLTGLTDWQGKQVVLALDEKGRVVLVGVNPRQVQTQDGQQQQIQWEQQLALEWDEDGKSAKISGSIFGFQINSENSKVDLNNNTLHIEASGTSEKGNKIDLIIDVSKNGENSLQYAEKRIYSRGIGANGWRRSQKISKTYSKQDDEWVEVGREDIYSTSSDPDDTSADHIRVVYSDYDENGTPHTRDINDHFGGKEAHATEKSESGDFTRGTIKVSGTRIDMKTGEVVPVGGGEDGSQEVEVERTAVTNKDGQEVPGYYMDRISDEEGTKRGRIILMKNAIAQLFKGQIRLEDSEAEELVDLLLNSGSQAAAQRLAQMIQQAGGNASAELVQQLTQAFERLKGQIEGFSADKVMIYEESSTRLVQYQQAEMPEEQQVQPSSQQPGGARAGGGAPGQGGRQGQPGQGGGQMPPGGWTPYGGQSIPQIAENRLFNPEGIFGTNDPVERINRIHNRYPEVINQWAQAMGMTPEEWMNKFRNLTRDDARRRWLKEQNIKATAQKLRTAYLKGLGLNDEQVSKVMSMLGDKEACINYLMQVLGISREEAEAIYNMLMSLGTEDGIRKYLEKLGYTEEEINAFIEKLNKMKEEKKQYLKELGLSDEEIEEILGMSKEEAEAKLKELGLTDEEIADYFAKEEEIRQYLKEEMGIEDEGEIDKILALDEEQARAYLENRSLDIDIDEFLALETDEEKLEYLKNYFINEKGMSEEEATQRAQEIMDKLSEIGDTDSNQPDVEALQKYFNEHDININLDEFLALGSEEEMLNYLKDYFLNNEDLSEEETQARAEEVMNDIRDMLGGAQGIEDKILEMYNYLEENNYDTEKFLKGIGFDYDKILEFRRLTEDHARYWFLTDTFENLIAQKNPDMSEEEVKEKAEWLAGLIFGKEVKEDMRLVPVSARERLREILTAWEDAAKELGLDKAGINDRLRQAVGQVQPGENPQQPGQPGQTPQPGQPGQIPQQPGAIQRVVQNGQNQMVVQPGQQAQPGDNTGVVQPQPNANRPSDEEIEQMLEGIVDDLIVSLLTGEMFPENAREVALNIMREHMQDFNWNGNGEGGDNDDNRPPIEINPPVQPVPMPENWTQNRAPWEVEGVDMKNWFKKYRNQFQTPQEFTAWTQAWKDWYENLLQTASALQTQNVQQILRRGSLVTRPGRGF